MPYTTLAKLTARFGQRMLLQLTDRATPPAGVVDTAIVDQAIADTDGVIDGYLAGRYQLPLADVPPQLADLALTIAIYKLHPFEPDPKIRSDYEQALKTLREIASGVFRLPIAGLEPGALDNSGVLTNDRERPFTEDNLKGFI